MAGKSRDNLIQITSDRAGTAKKRTGLIMTAIFAAVFIAEFVSPVIAAAVNGCSVAGNANVIGAAVTAVLVCAALIVFFRAYAEKSRIRIWIWAAGLAIAFALIAFLIFSKPFRNGAAIYANSILFNLNLKTGSVVYYYDFGAGNASVKLAFFMGAVSAFITLVLEMLSCYSRKIELLVLNFLFFAAAAIVLPKSFSWPAVVSGLLMLIYLVYCGTDEFVFRKKGILKALGMAAAFIAALILLTTAITEILPGGILEGLQASAVRKVEDLRFGKGDLTEGDLKEATARSQSGDPRLSVSVSGSGADHMIYLRGFVGSVYTGRGWKDLDDDAYRGLNLAMLQWLTQENEEDPDQDFIPISSFANALKLANKNAAENGLTEYALHDYRYEIRNTGASGKYMYVPVGLTTIDGIDASRMNRDLNIRASLFDPADPYTATSAELGMDDYIYLVDNESLTNADYQAENEYFILREQTYSDFVDEYYKQLPDEIRDYLDAGSGLDRDGREGASKAIWDVREYLETHMAYNDHPVSTYRTRAASSSDYIVNLLENDQNGYCVQYASAATLLLRYLGMPARYVEGYMIDTAAAEPGADGAYAVTDANAHAWAEIYRYGFGWVPVDVTPGRYNIPEDRQLIIKEDMDKNSAEEEEIEGGGDEEEEKDPEERDRSRWWVIALIVIMAILLVFVLRNLIVMRIRDKKIHSNDNSENIRVMTGLIVKNAALAGIDVRRDFVTFEADRMNDLVKGRNRNIKRFVRFEDARAAVTHAFYSRDGADSSDAVTVEKFMKETALALYEPAGFLKKLKLKYIDLVC